MHPSTKTCRKRKNEAKMGQQSAKFLHHFLSTTNQFAGEMTTEAILGGVVFRPVTPASLKSNETKAQVLRLYLYVDRKEIICCRVLKILKIIVVAAWDHPIFWRWPTLGTPRWG